MGTYTDRRQKEELPIRTYKGSESLPWQFSVHRSRGEIIVTQARGPETKFDPVVKRFDVEGLTVDAESTTFHHTVSRRVWSESPDRPFVQSQRSEGREVDFLYRDDTGWHIVRPETKSDSEVDDETAKFVGTELRGVTMWSTFLRSEEESQMKYTEERTYRVSRDCLEAYEEMYVLVCHEVNEESVANDLWEVADAVAHRLVSGTTSGRTGSE